MRSLVATVLALLLTMVLESSACAANDFNILLYHAPAYWDSDSLQVDSAFKQLRSFGVTLVSTNAYKSVLSHIHNNGIRLVSSGWGANGDRYRSNSVPSSWESAMASFDLSKYPFTLEDFAGYACWAPTSGENADYKRGYVWDTSGSTGSLVTDVLRGNGQVKRASVGQNSPGFIFPGFANYYGREMANPLGGTITGQSDYFLRAQLRIASIAAPDTSTVARMQVVNTWQDPNVCPSNDNQGVYRTEFVLDGSDSMLLVYHGNGSINTSVDTIHNAQIKTKTGAGYNRFRPDLRTPQLYEIGETPESTFCFTDSTGTTRCPLPFRFTRILRVRDFADTTTYESLNLRCRLAKINSEYCGGPRYNFYVQWLGTRSLYLDSAVVYNDTGRTLMTYAQTTIADSLDAFCNRWKTYVGADSVAQLFADQWEIGDEVNDMTFATALWFRQAVQFCTVAPRKILAAERPYDVYGLYPDNSGGADLYSYFYGTEMPVDPYPFGSSTDFQSLDISASNSALHQLDAMCFDLHKIVARIAQMPNKIDWWYVAQAFGGGFPTREAMTAQLNLGLCYNAKGFAYYHGVGDRETHSMAEMSKQGRRAFAAAAYLDTIDESGLESGSPSGLMNRLSNGRIVPSDTGVWNAAASVNHYARRNSGFFTTAEWHDVGDQSQVAGLSGSFISSISSTTPTKPAYLQVSFWTYNGDPYFFIVNKGTKQGDSSAVRILMPNKSGAWASSEIDSVEVRADTLWDSLGTLRQTVSLAPGSGKLFRLRSLRTTWSGVWDGLWSWYWPQFSTITVVGDITVPPANTMTIGQGAQITLASNSDSLDGGLDRRKCEIIVNGTLRLQGSASHPIVFRPSDTTKDSSWAGIESYGQLVADHIQVRGAYGGLDLYGSADTVQNSTIRDCFMDGVYSWGTPFYLSADTFWSTKVDTSMMYGVSVEGISQNNGPTVSGCLFKNVKFPVYTFNCWGSFQNLASTRFLGHQF